MFSKVLSAAIDGARCVPVSVEVDASNGLPAFLMVGDLSYQVKEAQERVRTAIRNSGMTIPPKRVTVNLAPADVRKDGNHFDLPIAASLMIAFGFLEAEKFDGVMLAGELGLNGRINGVRGILPFVETAYKKGCRLCIVPKQNYREARMIGQISVLGVESLQEFLSCARKENWGLLEDTKEEPVLLPAKKEEIEDFADIQGQEYVKRAAVIAAAGMHNFLMTGPKGTGKTMIARRIPGILPEPTKEELLEVSKIYSISGLLSEEKPFLLSRPFRAPHHTISPAALAGGGKYPKAGEITLAHKGGLFLDEFPEFSHECIELLRQPLEERKILISRSGGSYLFPADFMLVAAMNHCPCGQFPDLNRCSCTFQEVKRYQNRISGPILDRIDIVAEVSGISYQELTGKRKEKSSKKFRKEVEMAVKVQGERYQEKKIRFNSQLSGKLLEEFCNVSAEGQRILEKAYKKMRLSARAYHKILKTARTIADLEQEEEIKEAHISEALCYRRVEGKDT